MSIIHRIFLGMTILILAVVTTLLGLAFYTGYGPIDVFGKHLFFHQDAFKAHIFTWLGLFLAIANIWIIRDEDEQEESGGNYER